MGGAAGAEFHGACEVFDGDGLCMVLVDEMEDAAAFFDAVGCGILKGERGGLVVHVAEPLLKACAELAEKFHDEIRLRGGDIGGFGEEIRGVGG